MLTFWWKYQDPSNSLGLWSGVSGQHCSLQLLSLRVCSVQHICNTITIKKSTIIVLTLEQIISYSKQVKKYGKEKHYFQLPKKVPKQIFLDYITKIQSQVVLRINSFLYVKFKSSLTALLWQLYKCIQQSIYST